MPGRRLGLQNSAPQFPRMIATPSAGSARCAPSAPTGCCLSSNATSSVCSPRTSSTTTPVAPTAPWIYAPRWMLDDPTAVPFPAACIVRNPVLGGLINDYEAAACPCDERSQTFRSLPDRGFGTLQVRQVDPPERVDERREVRRQPASVGERVGGGVRTGEPAVDGPLARERVGR